ncbi:hypothetical protein RM704_06940 [Streptomyces sp. DSM 3412]|uniref:NADH:flavin oxidoreductase/NADH oxidase N-terminal domain-containing protein n=1 Tax=Streptomyces gottesmaniae TaxID=3075518 RepID=A0ABU2YSA7_9ACTN|nr:hypothetical protein [Streptomyces sp. DSM 3412]MDT0567200.1 hypothetical protein [Streptomyces sp. DSM 3412]
MTRPFDPVKIGRSTLKNRAVMPPTTRSRAYGPDASPTPLIAKDHAPRASAGVIVTEGNQPCVIGQGTSPPSGSRSSPPPTCRTVSPRVRRALPVMSKAMVPTRPITPTPPLPPLSEA